MVKLPAKGGSCRHKQGSLEGKGRHRQIKALLGFSGVGLWGKKKRNEVEVKGILKNFVLFVDTADAKGLLNKLFISQNSFECYLAARGWGWVGGGRSLQMRSAKSPNAETARALLLPVVSFSTTPAHHRKYISHGSFQRACEEATH